MKLRYHLTTIFVFILMGTSAPAQTSSDPNEGLTVNRNLVTGAYTCSWWGRVQRTYFLQESEDLVNWNYLPVIESGEEQVIQWGFTSTAPRLFVRLKYTDTATNDPFDDDFDGDGVSNYNELLQGTDPFTSAMDPNGLPLDWEKFYNIAVGTNSGGLAPRGDGLTYLQAFQQGLSPTDFYNGGTIAVNLVSGDQQSGNFGATLGSPLTVRVLDVTTGTALANAPVVFSSSTAQLSSTPSGNGTVSTLLIRTDNQGNASVYASLPMTGLSHQITATATSSANASEVVFNATIAQLVPSPQSLNASVDNGEIVNSFFSLYNPATSDCSYTINPSSVSVAVPPGQTPPPGSNPQYQYTDSDATNGPGYVWNDISTTGTKLNDLVNEDDATEQVNLGFNFPFYDGNFTTLWVCSNGFINFGPSGSTAYNNPSLPSSSVPHYLIAPFFNDLNTENGGNIYYQASANQLVIQYDNVADFNGGVFTFQVILMSSGDIVFYYKSMAGSVNDATVGIQGGASAPLNYCQVAYYQSYIHDNLAVQFHSIGVQLPPWLKVINYTNTGSIPAGQSASVAVQFSGVEMPAGTYTASLSLKDQNGNNVGPNVPVSMTATGNSLVYSNSSGLPDNWQMRYFGHLGVDPNADSDGDGYTNLQEFQYGFDPTDFYNGQAPNLTIVGGADQRAPFASGTSPVALSVPLSIQVGSGESSIAPVTFRVVSGHALISPSSDPSLSQPTTSLQVASNGTILDARGTQRFVAQAYIYLPTIEGDTSVIQASVTSGGRTVSVGTSAITTDPNLTAPSNLVVAPITSTTVSLSWTPTDTVHSTVIQGSNDGVNWFTIGEVGPNQGSASISGMTPDVAAYFRVFTAADSASGSIGSGGVASFSFGPNDNPGDSNPATGNGSNAGPQASVTLVSTTTLLGEGATLSGNRFGAAGFNAPINPPTRYLKEVLRFESVAVGYDPTYAGAFTTTTVINKNDGTETVNTVYDPDSYEGADWGGDWVVQSDTSRTRHGEAPDNGNLGTEGDYSDFTDTLSVPNDPADLLNTFNQWVPAFQNKFTKYNSQASVAPPGADELGFYVKALQYKWEVVPDSHGLIFWDVNFYPNSTPPPTDSFHAWSTGGASESPVYQIDPRKLNNGQNGLYNVYLEPTDTIKVEAFIPQEYVVPSPPTPLNLLSLNYWNFPLNGNYRKIPSDGSLDSGNAVFGEDGEKDVLKWKLYETVSVTTLSKDDFVNVNDDSDTVVDVERSSHNIQQGLTRSYKLSDIVNGHLSPTAVPTASSTGTPTSPAPTITHPAQGKVQVQLSSSGYDPLVAPSYFAPVDWNLTITIDRTDPTKPTYTITGGHQEFPAYEIFINGQIVHEYDPVKYGRGPNYLIVPMSVNEHGSLQ